VPTTPPASLAWVTSVTTTTPTGKYRAGAAINVTINFDQAVTLTGGNLSVNLDDGGSILIPPFSNATQVTGTYTV